MEGYFRAGKRMIDSTSATNKQTGRREFLQRSSSAVVSGMTAIPISLHGSEKSTAYGGREDAAQITKVLPENNGEKPLRLGLIIGVGKDPEAAMAKIHELALPTCQVYVEQFEAGLAERLRRGGGEV